MNRRSIVEAPIFNLINVIANIVLVNILFIVCSLPIVTIGVSYTSMYTVARKIKDRETLVFKTFFVSFKENFKQSTIAWLILLIPIIILSIETSLLYQVAIDVPFVLYLCVLIPFLFILVYFTWLLIQPSYFILETKPMFKNAFLFMLRLLPQDITILVLNVIPLFVFAYDTKTFLLSWPLWLFLYFSSSASLIALALESPMKTLGESIVNK